MLILTVKKSAFYQHLLSCEHWIHLFDLFRLQSDTLNLKQFYMKQIRNNTTVIKVACVVDIKLLF